MLVASNTVRWEASLWPLRPTALYTLALLLPVPLLLLCVCSAILTLLALVRCTSRMACWRMAAELENGRC